MACPQILTGSEFVTRLVTHIDCQSRYLGSFGYEALAQPGSTASTIVTGFLTLFVAIWGWRLMFGERVQGRDVMGDVLKVGIVLTLAFSWPAFRTVVHDVVLDGPAQIAAAFANPGIAPTGAGFVARLQGIDDAILAMLDLGTGRYGDQLLEGQRGVASFAGTALQDDTALGWARFTYVAGLVGSLGLLRLLAGLLLAMAPIAAGLLLFEATRGVFSGWLRGLVLVLIGSVGVTVILAVELAVLEPFLRDALQVRISGFAAPGAPVELFAIVAGFALVKLLGIWLLAKIAFTRGWPRPIHFPDLANQSDATHVRNSPDNQQPAFVQGRAERISRQVESNMRVERGRLVQMPAPAAGSAVSPGSSSSSGAPAGQGGESIGRSSRAQPLGSSYRRTSNARSLSSRRRDA